MGRRRMVTVSDRVEISTGLKAGWGVRKIAAHIGRDPSVVSREIRRNSTKTRGYRMVHADVKADPGRIDAVRDRTGQPQPSFPSTKVSLTASSLHASDSRAISALAASSS